MIKNFEQLKEMLKAMPVKRKVAVVPAQDEHWKQSVMLIGTAWLSRF